MVWLSRVNGLTKALQLEWHPLPPCAWFTIVTGNRSVSGGEQKSQGCPLGRRASCPSQGERCHAPDDALSTPRRARCPSPQCPSRLGPRRARCPSPQYLSRLGPRRARCPSPQCPSRLGPRRARCPSPQLDPVFPTGKVKSPYRGRRISLQGTRPVPTGDACRPVRVSLSVNQLRNGACPCLTYFHFH